MKNLSAKQALIYLVIALLVGASIFISWASKALPADEVALQALQSDAAVSVKEDGGLITFQPAVAQPTTGFIFYPGGRVDYRAYAPALKQVAARGYFVALVPVPLNFAYFNTNAARQVMDMFPEIQHWAVGGHSLGGVVAADFAAQNLDRVDGLVLWAAYPSDDSLAGSNLKVASIFGSNDLAGPEPFDRSRAHLPADTTFVMIEGGNHAQFGSYGPQPGDNPATISAEAQWQIVADATAALLASLTNR